MISMDSLATKCSSAYFTLLIYLCLHQGLGKTIQIIALIAFLVETRGIAGPYLVVAPSSVIPNWDSEFQQWAPALKVVAFRGTAQERLRIATTQVWSARVLGLAFLACNADVACKLSWQGRPSCCADARQLQYGINSAAVACDV